MNHRLPIPADGRTAGPMNMPMPAYQRYREMGIDDMLLENRVIFLSGVVIPETAAKLIQALLYLHSANKDADINLYINSVGGTMEDTLAVYDCMQFIPCKVATYCVGRAMGMSALLLAGGERDKRFALPHSKIMLHQPYGAVGGQAADIRIQAAQYLKDKAVVAALLAKHCAKNAEEIAGEIERDHYLEAHEAKVFGLVDEVLDDQEAERAKNAKNAKNGKDAKK
jgi:ATP-dependent Clp protease protease subunit